MDEGVTRMELVVRDRVRKCPPCPHLELRFDYETGISKGRSWESQTWVARCIHENVCTYRETLRARGDGDDGDDS